MKSNCTFDNWKFYYLSELNNLYNIYTSFIIENYTNNKIIDENDFYLFIYNVSSKSII